MKHSEPHFMRNGGESATLVPKLAVVQIRFGLTGQRHEAAALPIVEIHRSCELGKGGYHVSIRKNVYAISPFVLALQR